MPISIVVGGQYGSEGKGKVAAILAAQMNASFAIRCGGSNSGHTVYGDDGRRYVFRQLPTACLQKSVKNVLVSGSYIDVEILLREIAEAGLDKHQLLIDENAVIIENNDKAYEINSGLTKSIGSTGSGTGSAVVRRISRQRNTVFAKDVERLKPYITDTKEIMSAALKRNERLIIEGTQGFGLSLLHSHCYPYTTSRDTTAAGFLSECGLSPLDVDDVVMVIRAHPIRVAGDSGPLPEETTWEKVTQQSKRVDQLHEYTSVTKKLRRVANFDADVVLRGLKANSPSRIVLNHLDYVSQEERAQLVEKITLAVGNNIDFIGISPTEIIVNPYRKVETISDSKKQVSG